MSYNLKDRYSPEFYQTFCAISNKVIPGFNQQQFTQHIFDSSWEQRELKDRMKHTALVLHRFLPDSFPEAAKILVNLTTELKLNGITEASLEYMFLPAYIEVFGLKHFSASVKAMVLH